MDKIISAKGLLSLILFITLGVLPCCSEKEQPRSDTQATSEEEVKKEVQEAYDTGKAYTQEQVQDFMEQTEAKLGEYKDKIDQLEAKTKELSGDAKEKAEQQLAALRQKRDDVTEKLEELRSSGKNAWEQVKSGVDNAMEDLNNAYQKAVAEFSKTS